LNPLSHFLLSRKGFLYRQNNISKHAGKETGPPPQLPHVFSFAQTAKRFGQSHHGFFDGPTATP